VGIVTDCAENMQLMDRCFADDDFVTHMLDVNVPGRLHVKYTVRGPRLLKRMR
jgi:hypothetical protein